MRAFSAAILAAVASAVKTKEDYADYMSADGAFDYSSYMNNFGPSYSGDTTSGSSAHHYHNDGTAHEYGTHHSEVYGDYHNDEEHYDDYHYDDDHYYGDEESDHYSHDHDDHHAGESHYDHDHADHHAGESHYDHDHADHHAEEHYDETHHYDHDHDDHHAGEHHDYDHDHNDHHAEPQYVEEHHYEDDADYHGGDVPTGDFWHQVDEFNEWNEIFDQHSYEHRLEQEAELMVALESLREDLVHLDNDIDDLDDCISHNDDDISENNEGIAHNDHGISDNDHDISDQEHRVERCQRACRRHQEELDEDRDFLVLHCQQFAFAADMVGACADILTCRGTDLPYQSFPANTHHVDHHEDGHYHDDGSYHDAHN